MPRLHLIGIAGTAMAGLARIARELGWTVSGSDHACWPPASERLARLGIEVRPFSVANLKPPPDLVVVGNAIGRGNEELEFVLDAGIRYTSMPQFLADFVLPGRTSIVVAGTHGKTSTSSMLAWILERAGLAPGFLIGGLPENFDDGARVGAGKPFVLEGDEYDSAFFDKRSKFVHYRPRIAVLLNLEFDHADIFPDLAAIQRQFHQMIRTIPRSGLVVAPACDAAIDEVLRWECHSRIVRFGQESPWQWRKESEDASCFVLQAPSGEQRRVRWALFGEQMAANACAAAAAACEGLGIPLAVVAEALSSFRGVRRRCSLLAEIDGIRIFEDFAHHPTAISAVIAAMQARRKAEQRTGRLWVALEPASNTMRRRVHEARLPQALQKADRVLLVPPEARGLRNEELLDVQAVARALGNKARVCSSSDEVLALALSELRAGDDALLLSNAGFGGLAKRLPEALRKRR